MTYSDCLCALHEYTALIPLAIKTWSIIYTRKFKQFSRGQRLTDLLTDIPACYPTFVDNLSEYSPTDTVWKYMSSYSCSF